MVFYYFVGGKTSKLLLFINNETLSSNNTSGGRSNSHSRIEVIFSKGFERNPVTLFFVTTSTQESNSRERLSGLKRESEWKQWLA